jgi:hypothetical protein
VVNNYGVWLDEFRALGMDHTLERSWPCATCFFGEGDPVTIDRPYGRVCRRKLRAHLLGICSKAGVTFLPGDVTAISIDDATQTSHVTTREGQHLTARRVALTSTMKQQFCWGQGVLLTSGANTVAQATVMPLKLSRQGGCLSSSAVALNA